MENQPDLKLDLMLKDRVIKTYTFNQFEIKVGRDPNADICIDNTGISREHMKIEMNMGGTYVVKDLGSTNGIFLNGNRVMEEPLRNHDLITIGKFTLRVTIDKNQPSSQEYQKPSSSRDDIEGTTVLSKEQMAMMMSDMKKGPAPAAPPPKAAPSKKPPTALIIAGVAGVLAVIAVALMLLL